MSVRIIADHTSFFWYMRSPLSYRDLEGTPFGRGFEAVQWYNQREVTTLSYGLLNGTEIVSPFKVTSASPAGEGSCFSGPR